MNTKTLLGCKAFRETEDGDFEVKRIVRTYNDPTKLMLEDKDGNQTKVNVDSMKEDGYSILESRGVIMFSIVNIGNNKDVVVSLVKKIDMQIGQTVPCVICRQSVTDFFYNLLAQTEENEYVGVSCSDKTCPTNIEFSDLLLCDSIEFSEVVNIYLDDTIDSVLRCVNVSKYDQVLSELFDKHVDAVGNPMLKMKKMDCGWCKTLKDLLITNNFWIDIDTAFNITEVDFPIKDHIALKKDEAGEEYYSLEDDAMNWFSLTWFDTQDHKPEYMIADTIVTEYDYDIDLGEYHNDHYALVRDKDGLLYVIVYIFGGEFFESDLEVQKEEESLSRIFSLKVYNKYTGHSKSN